MTLKFQDSVKPNTAKSKHGTFLHSTPTLSSCPFSSFVLLSGVYQCQLSPRICQQESGTFSQTCQSVAASKRLLSNLVRLAPTDPNTANSEYICNLRGQKEQSPFVFGVLMLFIALCALFLPLREERELVFLGLWPLCVWRQNILC